MKNNQMNKIRNTENDDPFLKLFATMGEGGKGIEAQEAQGQSQLVRSSQLPIEVGYNSQAKKDYEKMGIKVIGPTKGDDLFYDVELPEGWTKRATEHSMHSELIDDKGRVRAGIFYKAAFYDRKADISFNKRISYSVQRIGFHNGDYSIVDGKYNSNSTPFCGIVKDFDGKELFKTKEIDCKMEFNEPNGRGGYTEKYKKESSEIEKKLTNKCLKFLNNNYPEYKDVHAYWNL